METESLCAARRKMLDAIAEHDNEDSVSRDYAVDAICERRAAYWTRAQYHSAASFVLCVEANSLGLDVAINRLPKHHVSMFGLLHFIDTLIPLNAKAERDIEFAKEHLA